MQEKTEEDVRDNLSMYKDLVSTIPVGVFRFTMRAKGEWQFDFVNSRFCELTGLNREDVLNNYKTVFRLINPDDRPEFISLIESVEKSPTPFAWVGRIMVNGETRWMSVESKSTFMDNGDIVWSGCFNDITARKRDEESLREREKRWKVALEGSRDGVWDWNPQTNEVFFSKQWKSMLGYDEHEIGTTLDVWDSTLHVDDKEQVYADIKRHLSGETPFYENEHRVLCQNGTYKWILDRGIVIERTDDGKPFRFIGTHIDISAQKGHEKSRRELVDDFQTFFETMDDIILVGRPDGKIVYANPAASQKLGYGADELKQMHILDLHPEEKRREAEIIFAEMFKGERDVCPLPLAKKDNVYLPVETRVWFGKWSGKDCIFGLSKDLSREQRALQKFNRLFDGNPAPMAVSSFPERKFTEVNEAFLSILGFSKEEAIGKTSEELGLLVDTAMRTQVAQALQDNGSVRNVELRVRKKNGTVGEGLFFGEIIENQGQKSLLTVMVDITDRRRAEKELAQKEALLRGLLDSIPDVVFFKDINGAYLGCNHQFRQLVGCDEKEIIGHTDYDIFDKGVADFFRENDRLMMEQGIARRNDEWIEYPDGRRVPVDTFKAPLRSVNGDIIGILGVTRDITDLKKAERKLLELNEELERKVADRTLELTNANRQLLTEIQEHADTASSLRDSEKSVRMIIESSPIGIFVIQDEKYSFVNQAFMRTFGLTNSSEVIGGGPGAPYRNDSGKRFNQIVRKCVDRSEMINVTDLVALTQDQRERHLNIWLQPTQFWGSAAVIGFMIDISEELELRSHLNQTQKMEALGSLAGGIAHDFNNVLGAIIGYTELTLSSVPNGSPEKRQLEQVIKAARRAADLVKHILTFSRETKQENKPLLIGPILKESLNFLRASISQNIEIRRSISANLHSVKADPSQIHQIIMNLATNAYHAMKKTGGALDVGLEEVDLDSDFVKTRPGLLPGTYQKLAVSDTGHGMTQETLQRIFDPYFTTKEAGQGTGLGLSVVDGIIREYGGEITVTSDPGQGTTFEVYLPIIIDQKISAEEASQSAPRGNGRILFVDDETMVSDATKANLEDLGYKVQTENDPVRAVARFEAQPYSFDLVITDMSMPKMTGLQLSRKIFQIREDLPIILITGFSDLLDDHNLLEYGIRELIQKPIRKVILAQTISSILTKQDH